VSQVLLRDWRYIHTFPRVTPLGLAKGVRDLGKAIVGEVATAALY